MAQTIEQDPGNFYKRDWSFGKGGVPIQVGDEIWRAIDKSIDWMMDSKHWEDNDGFADHPGGKPSLMATRMLLQGLWRASDELLISDAIPKLKRTHGDVHEEAFTKIERFFSSQYHLSSIVDNNHEMVLIGGFTDHESNPTRLTAYSTHDGVEGLLALEHMMGHEGTLDRFERDHPNAFPRILGFLESSWVQINEESGAYTLGEGFTNPEVNGTSHAIETTFLLMQRMIQTNPEALRPHITKLINRTPQMINFLKSVQYKNGGFGFVESTEVSNVMSINQVTRILSRLSWFNNPIQDPEIAKAFTLQHDLKPMLDRLHTRLMEHLDPETGAFSGYVTGEVYPDSTS